MVVYYSFLRRICRVSLEKDAVSLKCNSCKTRMTVVILNWQGWFKVIVWKCTARCIFVETKTPSVGGHQSTEQFYFSRGHQITLGLPQISTMLSSSFVLFSTKVETQLQRYASYFLTMLISTFFPRESVHALSQVFPNQLIIYRDLPWQQVFVLLGWLFHTAPLSALKIHKCRQIAKQDVERKKSLELDQGRLCLFVIARLLVDSRRPQQLPTTAFTCQLEYVLLANGSLFQLLQFSQYFVSNFPVPVQYLFVVEVVVDPSSQLWTTRTGGGGGGGKQRRDPGGVSC